SPSASPPPPPPFPTRRSSDLRVAVEQPLRPMLVAGPADRVVPLRPQLTRKVESQVEDRWRSVIGHGVLRMVILGPRGAVAEPMANTCRPPERDGHRRFVGAAVA